MKPIKNFTDLIPYLKECKTKNLQAEVWINGNRFWLHYEVEENGLGWVHIDGMLCVTTFEWNPGNPRNGELCWEHYSDRPARKLQMKPVTIKKLGKKDKSAPRNDI